MSHPIKPDIPERARLKREKDERLAKDRELASFANPPPAGSLKSSLDFTSQPVVKGESIEDFIQKFNAKQVQKSPIGQSLKEQGLDNIFEEEREKNEGDALENSNNDLIIKRFADCDRRKKFTVISYFTIGTAYEDEIRNLIESIKRFRLNYYIEGIISQGGWDENTKYKAKFIRRALDIISGPVVFIDADAIIQQYPAIFEIIKEDLAVHYRINEELLTGTMYWANNEWSRKLIDLWIEENEKDIKFWEQWVLRDILKKYKEISIYKLPPTYCQIFDIMRNEGIAVVEHFQGSRRFRNNLTTPSAVRLAILVPTKGRPQNLKRFVKSIADTADNPERIRIYFLVEPGDKKTEKVIPELSKLIDIVTIERENSKEQLNLSKLWNQLYREASKWADYYGFYGDDVEFRTQGWDTQIAQEFKKRGNNPWLIRTNDKFQKDTAVLFFTNKVLHDILGYYLPEYYFNICMDTHLSTITQSAGCFTRFDELITYHHCAIGGRAPKDDTHKNMKFNVVKDSKRYHSKEEQTFRDQEIKKLTNYMRVHI